MTEQRLKEPDSSGQVSPTFLRSQTLKETKRRIFMRKLKTSTTSNTLGKGGGNIRRSFDYGSIFVDETIQPYHSNSADLAKGAQKNGPIKKGTTMSDYFNKKKKEPKIIITPAKDETDNKKAPPDHPPEVRSIHEIADKPKAKSHIPGIFRKRSTKLNDLVSTTAQIRHRQSLTRSLSLKVVKNEQGRLLNIIANQAVFGKQPEVSKIFLEALRKVNAKALEKVKKEHIKKRKRRFLWYSRKLKEFFKHVLETWKPDSRFVIYWKMFILAMIVIQGFLSTYILAFLPDKDFEFSTPVVFIDLIFDFIYLFEIFTNFRIAFYRSGELRSNASEIALHYLRTTFTIDLISELSIVGRFSLEHNSRFFILFCLLRFLNVPTFVARIQDYYQFSRQVSSIIQVFKLCFSIILFAHWCACSLYSIAISDPNPINWITTAGLDDTNIDEIYVASLYWAITTMATIGYGDIHPTTYRERILSIVIMIASSIIFGYILSSIGSLLNEINMFNNESREKMRFLTKYMTEKGLTKDIQNKIRKYLEFYFHKENAMKMEGDNILQLLSLNLKEDIIREVNAKILGDSYMFSSNFRKKFLYIISKDLIERPLAPDDIIFSYNDTSDSSVYFVTSGAIDIFYEKCDISIQKLDKGDIFGFFSFFVNTPRTASAKSVEFSTIFQLKREKFLERLEEYPSEKETYCMIKDSFSLYENYQYLNFKCYSCGSKNHITLNCSKFHFMFNKSQIIKKYLLDSDKFQRDFKRKPRRKFRAYADIEEIQEAALQIQVIQQNELYYQSVLEDQVEYYSEAEEILDKNIYHPQPILYTAEATQIRALDVPISYTPMNSLGGIKDTAPKRKGHNEIGDVQSFVMANYDKYYHSMNIDRVKNFEVYYPNSNITKLLVGFEKERLEKMVQMRLGVNAKHISPLLVKSFKMNERRKNSEIISHGSMVSYGSNTANAPNTPGRKTQVNKNISMINPSDITMYNSLKKTSVDFGIQQQAELNASRPRTLPLLGDQKGPKYPVAYSAQNFQEREWLWTLNGSRNTSIINNSEEIPEERALAKRRELSQPIMRLNLKNGMFKDESKRLMKLSDASSSQSGSDSDFHNVFSPKFKGRDRRLYSDNISNKERIPDKSPNFLEISQMPRSLFVLDNLSVDADSRPRKESSGQLDLMRISQFKINSSVISENDLFSSPIDFTKQMQKISRKLGENRSPIIRLGYSSGKRRKPPNNQELVSLMLKEKKVGLRKKKGRSNSQDQDKHVKKIIEEYGIHNIMKRVYQEKMS